jgi:phosphatidylglycerol:prolipoprotein diacylglycerol transferase
MELRYTYALFMFLALVVFVVVRQLQPKSPQLLHMPWWQRTALALAAFVGGVVGAKASFAFAQQSDWLDIHDWFRAWFTDGKTITTGLIGAYLAVEITKLALGINVKTGDSFALPLACAMAVGRWGCFFNGCCNGTPTDLPWGVSFHLPDGDIVRCHPTQVYESLFHLAMACVLVLLIRYDLLRYQRLKFYLICYCIYRFVTEYIRPEPIWWAGLTFYQWAAIALAAGLAVQWIWDSRLTSVGQASSLP